ncbi:hypothetical protein IVB12_15925 [Bradyrhizobium sp. 179]|uniref:hypothetical protein n=1 Tax=Bradyrhizobium sp. 179 TaxID=2782648 RepID=UPI001FFB17F4|nr:hypothetical protein [Bradyrhizobium sp. 179]MCK1543405.1 hypothetical protein [Bradyrhizobium sp. 179]
MNGKVINAFGRKDGDPLPGQEADDKPQVCENTLAAVEALMERVKAGEIQGIGVACIGNGYPLTVLAGPPTHDARDLSVLLMSVELLKRQVVGTAVSMAEVDYVEEDEE